ncbi:MAG: large-conductance mechanosensitive channel protein MscL [Clostridiales Family XIII bacterium]|jgi:large conductance mechanosensitive channel|nr:large-conductance mechanosensitive channel protein MscL [Clostridiales Family XIII bacterium]
MADIDVNPAIIKANLKKHKGIVDDFKQFALRGNVVDMAVGIVIGAAFGNIVNSFVKDLIMPLVGLLTAGKDFSKMMFSFGDGDAILYGAFIQAVINFFVIALSIFIVVRVMNRLSKPKDEPAPDPTELDVLNEIRDLLKAQK